MRMLSIPVEIEVEYELDTGYYDCLIAEPFRTTERPIIYLLQASAQPMSPSPHLSMVDRDDGGVNWEVFLFPRKSKRLLIRVLPSALHVNAHLVPNG